MCGENLLSRGQAKEADGVHRQPLLNDFTGVRCRKVIRKSCRRLYALLTIESMNQIAQLHEAPAATDPLPVRTNTGAGPRHVGASG